MNSHQRTVLTASALMAVSLSTHAQNVQQSAAIASSDVLSQISMFNYRDGPKAELLFRGTPIAATAQGTADVEYQNGNARISAKVGNLPPPASIGPYTTYVLWALTPDGRAVNQGVLAGPEDDKGELDTSYGASQFALIVTAEPHFAVSVPSTMIALYNVADDVEGATESKVTTLTERADYSSLPRVAIDDDSPVELVQAKYAVAIADAAGAAKFAPQEYAAATQKLGAAQTAAGGKRKDQKESVNVAREAIVAGEDARRAAMLGAEKAAADEAAAKGAAAAAAAAAATAAEVERERGATAARADLLNRLNAALPTRESDRGLVSEIGGVQFATGAAQMNAAARESLSRFAGIIASYPTLRLNVEGHTDNTGSVATNNELSYRRAIAVRDYLIGTGIAASRIDVAGLGLSQPIADNSTNEGRARNRRVEIVISGPPLTAQ